MLRTDWHFVSLVRDAANLCTLKANLVEKDTDTAAGNAVFNVIGRGHLAGQDYQGDIAGMRFYDHALSDGEESALFNGIGGGSGINTDLALSL